RIGGAADAGAAADSHSAGAGDADVAADFLAVDGDWIGGCRGRQNAAFGRVGGAANSGGAGRADRALSGQAIVENLAGVFVEHEVHLHRTLGLVPSEAAGDLHLNLAIFADAEALDAGAELAAVG